MDQKKITLAIIIIGIIIGLTGILADVIGLGGDTDHFGPRQTLVTAVGAIVLLAGAGLYFYGDRFFNKEDRDSNE